MGIYLDRGGSMDTALLAFGAKAQAVAQDGTTAEQAAQVLVPGLPATSLFSKLVLGNIETKFCNQIRILQQFSK